MCGKIKKVSGIVEGQKQIQSEVDSEKWDQEQPRDTHQKFSPDWGAHETAHKKRVVINIEDCSFLYLFKSRSWQTVKQMEER